jgi:hypothetical protein
LADSDSSGPERLSLTGWLDNEEKSFVSNVIDFLERFGQDADLRHAGDEAVAEALRNAGIEPALQAAVLDKDQRALQALLGADTNVCCMVFKEDEEEETEEEEGDEDDEHEPDEDKPKAEVSSRRLAGRVA